MSDAAVGAKLAIGAGVVRDVIRAGDLVMPEVWGAFGWALWVRAGGVWRPAVCVDGETSDPFPSTLDAGPGGILYLETPPDTYVSTLIPPRYVGPFPRGTTGLNTSAFERALRLEAPFRRTRETPAVALERLIVAARAA